MAGTPDVLSSPSASPHRRWVVLAAGLAVVAAAVTFAVTSGGSDGTEQTAAPAETTSAVPTGRQRPTSSTIDPADRTTGSLPGPAGLPIGTSAIEAARAVADSYCDRISSWRLTLNGEEGEYRNVVALLRPAGPAYSNVVLQIELTWDTDHYDWAASRSALESCP